MIPARPIRFHPSAVAEARAAFLWYRERSRPASRAFVDRLDDAIERIQEAPERWPEYLHGTRRFLLRRFPFFVVYRLVESDIQIVAIAHAHRRPGYWRQR